MDVQDQDAIKELFRNSLDGGIDDIEEAVRIVFEGDDDDFERQTENLPDPFRDSLREVFIATEFIVFE